MSELDDSKLDEILDHLFAGRKLEAIKLYKDCTGNSLLKSKQFIESLQATLKEKTPEEFKPPSTAGCGSAALMIALAAAILGFWLT